MGTVINVLTVLAGCSIGILMRKKIPDPLKNLMLQGVGLVTILLGIQMGLKTENILIPLAGLVIGGIIGYILMIERKLNEFAGYISRKFSSNNQSDSFIQGFITSSLIFCVGPMTILGSINDGMYGDYHLLAVKSMLDGFTAIALTATFGLGVFFSIGTIIIVQGGITVFALYLGRFLTDQVISETTAVGGIMIIGIGLLILKICRMEISNFLPALIITPLIVLLAGLWV
ncbi:MAG: DUF554 domain-containing protein [Calditrichaceae bacterium]|nr:DUF554 domain-containing protein [Calditrichaceae bacterium]MBN2710374.1 DUF554 domain-containing protein [Calditrichaceae bacterium]RQV92904.1 MAG: DUF554 domain-containing protein [Calditrichota bacterium]